MLRTLTVDRTTGSMQTRKSPARRIGTPIPGSRPNRETARFPIPDSRPNRESEIPSPIPGQIGNRGDGNWGFPGLGGALGPGHGPGALAQALSAALCDIKYPKPPRTGTQRVKLPSPQSASALKFFLVRYLQVQVRARGGFPSHPRVHTAEIAAAKNMPHSYSFTAGGISRRVLRSSVSLAWSAAFLPSPS